MKRSRTIAIFAGLALASALASAACEDVPSDQTSTTTTTGSTTTTSSGTTSSGGTGGTTGTGTGGMSGTGGAGGALDCYPNPMTHVEIINACTDAQKIDAMPILPLLEADGGLPTLP